MDRATTRSTQSFNRHFGRMAVSATTFAEMPRDAQESSAPPANLAVVEDFCSRLEVLPYSARAAQHHGAIRAAPARLGLPISVNELPLAAHARSEGLTLEPSTRASSSAFRSPGRVGAPAGGGRSAAGGGLSRIRPAARTA